MNAELTTIVIPDVPQMEFKKSINASHNFGNFLTIPTFVYPVRDNIHSPIKESAQVMQNMNTFICPQITISRAESNEHIYDRNNIQEDEGIDVDVDIYQKVIFGVSLFVNMFCEITFILRILKYFCFRDYSNQNQLN